MSAESESNEGGNTMYREFINEKEKWTEVTISADWDENQKYLHHYVAFAIPGLTFAAAYFGGNCDVNYKELFYVINSANEAATLFPLHKATFFRLINRIIIWEQ